MNKIKLKKLILLLESGSRPKGGATQSSGTIPSLGAEHLAHNGTFKFDKLKLIPLEFYQKMSRGKIQNNSILLVKDGATTGKISFINESFPYEHAAINEHLFQIIIDDTIAFPKYIYYFLKSDIGNRQILKSFRGMIGGINQKFINSVFVPLPENLYDQIRISNLLSQLESLIAKREESIRLLDELLKSTFLDLFGDPVLNSKEWERLPLKKFGNIITGNTPPRVQNEFYNNQYIEWIKTDNIFPDEMYISNSKEYLSKEGLKKGRYLKSGSLLVTCIAGSIKSIGTAALSDRPVAFNQQMNAIEPNDKVNSFYLYWLFKIGKKYFQDQAGKGMKKIITKSTFEKIVFPLPPKALQDKFAIIVQQVEQSKSAYQLSLKQLNNLFGSLSQQAFSGELELSKLKIDKSENNNLIVDQPENYNVLIEQNTTQDFSVWNDIAKPVLDGLVLGAVIGAAYNLLTPKKEIENNSNANDNVIKPQDFDEVYEAVARPISNTLEDGTTVSGFQIDEDALFSLIKAASKNGATFEDVQMQLQGKGHSIPYDEDTDKRITGLTLKESVFKLLKSNELVQEFDEDKKQIVLKSLQ